MFSYSRFHCHGTFLTLDFWVSVLLHRTKFGWQCFKVCAPSALTHELVVAGPHSMFQVLLNTLLDGVFQKYLPIFFVGRKTELCSAISLFIFCKILNYIFHFTSCQTCCIATRKKLIIVGIIVLLHIEGHVTLILMDMKRLGVLAAILCVWHLCLSLINRGS
jgi:hypothetical protein